MFDFLQGKKFKCAFCDGAGIQPRSLQSRCSSCRGKGEVKFNVPAITCDACQGKGNSPIALGLACIPCKGVGTVKKEGKFLKELGNKLQKLKLWH